MTKGQMAWLPSAGSDSEKVLHLRPSPLAGWQPYTRSPSAVPDYNVPRGSKGWATYQKLLKCGWELVATDVAIGQRVGVEK